MLSGADDGGEILEIAADDVDFVRFLFGKIPF